MRFPIPVIPCRRVLSQFDGIVMNLVLCSDIEVWKNVHGRGGVAVHIYELSRALTKFGNAVTILQPSKSSWKQDIENNLTIIGIPHSAFKGLGTLNYSLGLYKKLQTLIGQNFVDAIQFHNLTGLMTYLHMKNLPIPIWTKCHGVRDIYIKSLGLDGSLKIASFIYDSVVTENVSKLCYRLSPYIIANSRSTMENLVRYYNISPQRISVVYNGVNHKLFNPKIDGETIKNKLRIGGLKVVLYVGDFSLLKGVYHLILSFKRVIKNMSNACLLMVGGYREDSYVKLRDLISQTGLGKHVKIIGFVPYPELPNYYAAADLCVVPSLCEPFGNVALETIASGKPLIASRTGGLAEILNTEAGMLVNLGDINLLSRSIIALLKNEDLRVEMGRRAYEHSLNFSWEKTARETLYHALHSARYVD